MNEIEGKKFDQNKLRLDLIPASTSEALGRVLTFGANKYEDHNWEKGLKWSRVIGALERHIMAIKRREDYDPESGLLHCEHVLANASFLNHFYRTFPEGDDRPQRSIKQRKLGLDIDGVIANFMKAFKLSYPDVDASHWIQTSEVESHMMGLSQEFWLSIEPLISPSDIPIEPTCYITKRETCYLNTVVQWLKMHGFPMAPVYFANKENPKSKIAKQVGIDVFVEDKYSNFMELNDNEVLCFLLDQPHNQKFDVGYKRIYSLSELTKRFNLFY